MSIFAGGVLDGTPLQGEIKENANKLVSAPVGTSGDLVNLGYCFLSDTNGEGLIAIVAFGTFSFDDQFVVIHNNHPTTILCGCVKRLYML